MNKDTPIITLTPPTPAPDLLRLCDGNAPAARWWEAPLTAMQAGDSYTLILGATQHDDNDEVPE